MSQHWHSSFIRAPCPVTSHGQIVILHLSEIFTTGLSHYTLEEFQCTTDSIGLHLFSYSLQCLHLQLLVNLVPPLRCELNSLTPLLCQVYLGPGLNPSQKSVRETQTTPLCFTYNLSLTPSLSLFLFPSHGSKPNHWRSLICERALHHQETINNTSNCHIAGISPGLGLCLNILCVTVHASSQNQNFLVLSGSLTLEQCCFRALSFW